MSRPLTNARMPLALLGVVAALEPMAAQVYLAIWSLPGAETAEGWRGSKRGFVSEVSSITGKAKESNRLTVLLQKLKEIGAIGYEVGTSSFRVWVIRDCDQRSENVITTADHRSADVITTADHLAPPPPAPPLPDLHLDRCDDLKPLARSEGAGVRDVCINKIPVRAGRPVFCAADGLAEEVRAAGLKLSDTRVENLVRRSDSAEVRRQLGWWERRKKLWGTWKPGSPERVFENHCINRDLEPDDKPQSMRSTRPDSRTVDEVFGAPEARCRPEEWLSAHPEGAQAWLEANAAKKRGQP